MFDERGLPLQIIAQVARIESGERNLSRLLGCKQ